MPTASAQSNPTVASWCSESGDACYSLFLRRGKVVAQYHYADKYMSTVKVCVRPPARAVVCRKRPLQGVGSPATWVARFSMKARPGVWRMPLAGGAPVRLRVRA